MSPEQPPTDRRKQLWLALGILAAVVAGGVLAALLLTRGDNGGTTTGAATVPVASTGETAGTSTASPGGKPTLETTAVPSVIGLREAAAISAIEQVGLTALSRLQRSPGPPGLVVGQNPAAGVPIPPGSAVGLVISIRGGTVPAVVGLPAAEAAARVHSAGLQSRAQPVDSDRPAGTVVRQSPAAGFGLKNGPVLLSISKGPPRVAVPDVLGLRRNAARQLLRSAGFPATFAVGRSPKPVGIAFRQFPSAGTSIPRGTTVHVTLAGTGASAALVAVPDVEGLQQAEAARILRAAGLKPAVARVHSLLAVGVVTAQSPAAGARVAPGATVTISVSTGPGP